MGKPIRKWSDGSIAIAVEAGKQDAQREEMHVHVYKNGRRTDSRLPGSCMDIDEKDARTAERLYQRNYDEIREYYEAVADGVYDS